MFYNDNLANSESVTITFIALNIICMDAGYTWTQDFNQNWLCPTI